MALPKFRYKQPGKQGFVWAEYGDLPEYAKSQEGVIKQMAKHGLTPASLSATAPEPSGSVIASTASLVLTDIQVGVPEPAKPHDYSDLIDAYLAQLREARETLRRSTGDRRVRDECEMKIDQYGAAIENAKAAEQITDDAANFVSLTGEFSFRLPPRVDGEYTTETRRSQSRCYLTTDPLEIAWLRRMTRGGTVQEVPLTKRVAVPKDGKPPRIVEATTWFEMLDMDSINP